MTETRSTAHTGTSFEDVLAAARQGEQWAWESIYLDLIGNVTGYLRSQGSRDPQDLASEVFLQVARDIGRFDGDESSFRSWVFVIAHRRLIDERRASGRQPKVVALTVLDEPPGGDVETEALRNLGNGWVMDILNKLTPSQREVLVLRVIADLSLAETASVMGKNVGAIKALQRRALISVSDLIERLRVTQ